MARPRKSAPTPDQIAMYGHVAVALRKVLHDREWTVGDMNQACGFERNATILYPTLRSSTAPSQAVRQVLMDKIGMPEQDLLPRELATQSAPKAHLVRVDEPRQQLMRPLNPNPVLQFTVSADGTARIKLDAAMSLAAASPLLRILLDAGIVPSTQGDDNDSVQ